MTRYLIAVTPVHGHVMPMLTIAKGLTGRGHHVRVLTGSRFASAAAAAGADHVPLPPPADYDDRDPDTAFPQRRKLTGLARLRFDMDNIFINPIPAQAAAVTEQLADPADAVLTDSAFLGAIHLLHRPRTHRPTVGVCGVLPLSMSSRDTAPFGLGLPPSSTPVGRARNHVLNLLTRRLVFAGCQRNFQRVIGDLGLSAPETFYLDALPLLADRFFQLTVPSFEYPRSDQPPSVVFAGPVLPVAGTTAPLPDWWHDLDGRTVVHITQGTIDNHDLSSLIGPTLRALADEDVLTVATTGGQPIGSILGPLPDNARVAEFIPYDLLLPQVDVMVTNGGYGGVQYALAHGVPLVVAGGSEDKPEVAARVHWSGAGINLRTGRPTQPAIRAAVTSVFQDPSYRRRAAELRADMAHYRPLDIIESSLAGV
jgi:UDP:flavonoid glycosyltransferase YjiC (YdhE family)